VPIIGNTKAPTFARLGVARLGATRLDYYQPWVRIKIAGEDITDGTRRAGFSIFKSLSASSGRCALKFDAPLDANGMATLVGKEVEVYVGDTDETHMLFAGNVMAYRHAYDGGVLTLPVWEVACVDYGFQLNKILITSAWGSISVSNLLHELRDGWAPTWNLDIASDVTGTLDSYQATYKPLRSVLDDIAESVGAKWYVSAGPGGERTIHFFVSVALGTSTPIGNTAVGAGIVHGSYARTEDGGDIITRVWSEGSGTVPLLNVPAGANSIPVLEIYHYENPPSNGTSNGISVTPWLRSGTTTFRYNGTRAANNAGEITYTRATANVGDTGLSILAGLGWPSQGWITVGENTIRYTGMVINPSPPHALTGIPASGYGSITTPIANNVPVTVVASVTANTATLVEDLKKDQQINLLFNVEFANTVPANTDDSWGFPFETYEVDNRRSAMEAIRVGKAILGTRGSPVSTVSYSTYDQTARPGYKVDISVGANTGKTYVIQTVTITRDFVTQEQMIFPMRQVEASDRQFTYAGFMRKLREATKG
jgi:hypothetical protein